MLSERAFIATTYKTNRDFIIQQTAQVSYKVGINSD